MKQSLAVLGFGLVAPGRGGTATDPAASDLPKLDLTLLERTLRRGLSEVTRLFMHAAKLALDDAGCQAAQMHVIFASAFGEIATAEALLAAAYDADSSSPARFRNSVHNTAAGLLSISSKNHLPCTALAAGWETVPMALFEAIAQLDSDPRPVLLVFAEECVPSALSVEHPHGPLAAAFVLARGDSSLARPGAGFDPPDVRARGRLLRLRRVAASTPSGATHQGSLAAEAEPHDLHPLAVLRPLVRALEHRDACTVALSEGEQPWCVDVQAEDRL